MASIQEQAVTHDLVTNESAAFPGHYSARNVSNRLVAIGASAGGLNAFSTILAALPENFPAPIVIVQHLSAEFPSRLAHLLSDVTRLPVKEAQQDDWLQAGRVYVAPPGKHLVINSNLSLSLSLAPKVHHCRPSADVLFRSAAASFAAGTIGVVLTGGDGDGSDGIRAIKAAGGVTIAQDLPSSQQPSMPLHAAATGSVDYVLPLPDIAAALVDLVKPNHAGLDEDFANLAFEDTALCRVQAAWRSAGSFSGEGARPHEINRLVTKALEEIDGCREALAAAEAALVDQNDALEVFQRSLRNEHLRYDALMNLVSNAVIETDRNGIIRAVNSAAAGLLGRSAKYMIGRSIDRYACRDKRFDFRKEAAQALVSGKGKRAIGLNTRRKLAPVTATVAGIEDAAGGFAGLHWLVCREDTKPLTDVEPVSGSGQIPLAAPGTVAPPSGEEEKTSE